MCIMLYINIYIYMILKLCVTMGNHPSNTASRSHFDARIEHREVHLQLLGSDSILARGIMRLAPWGWICYTLRGPATSTKSTKQVLVLFAWNDTELRHVRS